MPVCGMRAGIAIELGSTDRQRLAAIVADRNTPQKHVWRAQIVLLTAEGCGTEEIMRQSGTAKTTVWRWQERFMTDGVAGLLHDKTRPSRIPPLSPAIERSVVTRTLGDPPGEAAHWTAAAMAKESDISVSSVQRIWRKHGLQPHRARHFKLSNDPHFAGKLHDIVGLYVDAECQPASWSTPLSITMPLTSIPRFLPGSCGISDGPCTSRPPLPRGSTPSRVSSPG